jgi:hypothetical protein
MQALRKFTAILRNLIVHHRFRKSPPLHPILSQFDPVPTIPSHSTSVRSILILSTHLRLSLPSGLYPSRFPTNILYEFLVSNCADHLTLLDLIILIMYGEGYNLWSSSLCSFLQSPVISSLLGQIFFSAPCSQTPSGLMCCSSLEW